MLFATFIKILHLASSGLPIFAINRLSCPKIFWALLADYWIWYINPSLGSSLIPRYLTELLVLITSFPILMSICKGIRRPVISSNSVLCNARSRPCLSFRCASSVFLAVITAEFFFIFRFCCLTCDTHPGFTSNKLTHRYSQSWILDVKIVMLDLIQWIPDSRGYTHITPLLGIKPGFVAIWFVHHLFLTLLFYVQQFFMFKNV